MYTNRKVLACPTCGNTKTDDRVYRCPNCGRTVCDQCSYYGCFHCDSSVGWNDQVGWIGNPSE